jgi:3-oxoacyl-[acyl-carrier-protein] synthase II
VNPDSPPIALTGWGLVTPLGRSTGETWQALFDSRAITDHSPAALPREEGVDRLCQLSSHAAREAMGMAGWDDASAAALVLGTSKGPVETWLPTRLDPRREPNGSAAGHLAYSVGQPPHASAGYPGDFGISTTATRVAENLGLTAGPRYVLSAACASGLYALVRAAMLLDSGEVERALVLAVESSLHPLFRGCFQRLGVLPPAGVGCRPFDRQRAGFLMSEAAAAVCLERAGPDHPRVYLDRFAVGGAAGHLTSGDSDGAALRYLLGRVIDGRAVDLVHAHATATVAHDPLELAAIEETVAGDYPPAVYSHKGALGHSLGAAGLVSIVLNCLAHTQGRVPPNVNTTDPLPTSRVRLSRKAVARPLRRSLATASGFGGPTAVVSLVSF